MIPLFDRVNQTRVRNASAASGALSLIVAILAISSLPALSRQGRTVSLMISTLASLTAISNFRVRDQQNQILADHETIADQARQNFTHEVFKQDGEYYVHTNLYNPPIPADQPVQSTQPNSNLEYFDWSELSDEVEYPHLAILNKTGGGKSTLAQWLATQMGGLIYVLDPHYEPNSYKLATLVIGKGRNVGESAESWHEITNKKGEVVGETGEPEISQPNELASCTQFINWLHREMVRRYDLRSRGITDFETINVIMDEFSSYAKKEGVPIRFKELIREARKVKIRLYVLIQGSQVGDLGLEGSSDLRANLTFIRLGKFAIEYAQQKLRNCKPNTEAYRELESIVYRLKQPKRCALIGEDQPAIIPEL